MTGIAEYMKEGGYATHFVGKWDAGMATPKHTPHGRGYDTSLNYFAHENDYWSQSCLFGPCCIRFWNNPIQANLTASLIETYEQYGFSLENSSDIVDLWDTNGPAREINGTGYEEFIFRDRILDILDTHNQSDPLFLYYAPHVAHCPLQVPEQYLEKFDFITNDSDKCIETVYALPHKPYTLLNTTQSCRKQYRSMVNLLDDIILELEAKLIEKGLWNDTLLVLTSDNGGPIDIYETGATNFGHRGGKNTDWEGGIRAAAFLSGGYIPEELRGTNLTEPIHIADWYATLPALAGVEVKPHGDREDFTLPQVDAVNVWPYVMGEVDVSPRQEIPVSLYTLVSGDYKLIWRESVTGAGWSDRDWPNATSEQSDVEGVAHNCTHGCLFNVRIDKAERYDISSEHPTLLQALKMRLFEVREYYYSNEDDFDEACPDDTDVPCPCWMAVNRYDGYYGPYAKLDE